VFPAVFNVEKIDREQSAIHPNAARINYRSRRFITSTVTIGQHTEACCHLDTKLRGMAGCEYSSSEQLQKQSGKLLQQLLEYSVVSNCETSRSKACVQLTGSSERGYRLTTEERPLFFNRRVRVKRASMLLRGLRFIAAGAAAGGNR
jgi:hypothetical protein